MPDRPAFLRVICERPEDDAPRLVYADWLEEEGECAQSQFIRVQCELQRSDLDKDRERELVKTEDKLLRRFEKQWRKQLPQNLGWVWEGNFVRGFLDSLTLEPIGFQDFLISARTLFQAVPLQRLTIFMPTAQDLIAFAELPEAELLRELTLLGHDQHYSSRWHPIRSFPALRQPREASLEDVVEAIAFSSRLQSLRAIRLMNMWVPDEAKELLQLQFGERLTVPSYGWDY
jgi:uncharacterized protein (TIGR02996 family)